MQPMVMLRRAQGADAMNKRLSAADIAAMTSKASHRVLAAKSPSEIRDVSAISLSVFDVDFYDKNPRHHRNERYDEIKASIEAKGLESTLFITKRPGSQRYMLARGGNTRLAILRELAQDDPGKWQQLTFMEVPWTTESEVLASHLIENTERSALCFWDEAQALQEIKKQILAEQGRPISTREFSELLKSKGVNVDRKKLMCGEFALSNLSTLDMWRPQLGTKHVQEIISPKLRALSNLWLLKFGQDESGYWDLVRDAIAGEGGGQPYSVELLIHLVVERLAQTLGLEADAVAMLLAQGRTEWASFAELQAALSLDGAGQKGLGQSGADDAAGGGGLGTTVLGGDQGGEGSGLDAGASSAPAAKPTVPDHLRQQMAAASQRRTDVPGIPGVTLRSGKDVQPIQLGAGGGSQGGAPGSGIHGGPLNPNELALLEQLGPEGLAKQVFFSELRGMAHLAGIAELIKESVSPYLEYGFYVELPTAGMLGTSPDDVAIQAWWLFCGFSGQLHPDVVPYLQDPVASMQGGQPAMVDAGPGSMGYLINHPESRDEVFRTCLGGIVHSLSDLLLVVMTHEDHLLHEAMIRLLDAAKHWNTARRAS